MKSSEAELVVADLAAGQWGLVTTPQAVAAGLTRVQLARLCTAGALVRLTHGVYAVRAAMATDKIELYAAWLALAPARSAADRLADGPGGPVVSHASAATLFGHGDLDADRHEFTSPTRKQTRRTDLRLHQGVLGEDDVTIHRGLPITTPARTVVDLLVDGHDGGHVAGVLADAVRARQVDLAELEVRLAPYAARFGLPRRDGKALLRYLLELGGVAEQADADELASIARESHLPVSAVAAAALSHHAALDRATLGVAELDRVLALPGLRAALEKTALSRQLSELQAAITTQLPHLGVAELQAAIAEQLSPARRLVEVQAAITEQNMEPYRRLQQAQQVWADQIASVVAQQVPSLGLIAAQALAQDRQRLGRALPPQLPGPADGTNDVEEGRPDDGGEPARGGDQ